MAETLFGDATACIKIDCAEFQHSHEIARLIGSPPGYLGYRETNPLLKQRALQQWHTDTQKLCIVLFDEIEKASDALWQLLLGVLDKATLTLGDNRRVDFSQCIIVMTSNLGASEMNRHLNRNMGFTQAATQFDARFDQNISNVAINAARNRFSPEFMNRIDKVVVFRALRPEHLEEVLEIELGLLQQRILQAVGDRQFAFSCTPELKQYLLREGTDLQYGARHLKRAIERNLVFPLADLVATKQIEFGDLIRVDVDSSGETKFAKQAQRVPSPSLIKRYMEGRRGCTPPEGAKPGHKDQHIPAKALQFDDPSLHANHGGLGAIIGVQLRKDGFDPALNGFFRNRELICDLLVGIACGNQSQHSDFRRRQCVVGSMLSDFIRRFGRKRLFPGMNRPDSFDQLLVERGFQEVPGGPGLHCSKNLRIAFVGRQHNDFRLRKFSADRQHRIEAVHLWHLQIHQRYVWPMGTKLLDSLAAIRGFADQSHVRLSADQYRDALPDQGVIVHRKNPNLRYPVTHARSSPSHRPLPRSARQRARSAAPLSRRLSQPESATQSPCRCRLPSKCSACR